MLTVGLTGGVASGKTTVALAFIALGAPLLEADQVSRDVVAPGSPALAEIGQRFGAGYLLPDGTLDRRRLRERVFADSGARRALEAITHPHIRAAVAAWRAAQTAPYCILSNAIMVESGMDAQVDRLLVVDAPTEVQLERLVRRDGIEEALARQMIAAQASRERRLARAQDVIDNREAGLDLRPAVARLHRLYSRALFADEA
jgi:dephospho-CoA kinase